MAKRVGVPEKWFSKAQEQRLKSHAHTCILVNAVLSEVCY